MEEFIMYPFSNYIGIIMPYRLKRTHTRDMHGKSINIDVYAANVIDPVEDFETFRRSISI